MSTCLLHVLRCMVSLFARITAVDRTRISRFPQQLDTSSAVRFPITWASRIALFFICACCGLVAEPGLAAVPPVTPSSEEKPFYPPPAVTNGLIHRWVNLFDVHDEVTGQEGRIMGVVPPVQLGQNDETAFDEPAGWVELRPPITNEVFTVCFWARLIPFAQQPPEIPLEFEPDEAGLQWLLEEPQNLKGLLMLRYGKHQRDRDTRNLYLSWHFYAFSGSRNGEVISTVDGVALKDRSFHWRPPLRSQPVGNSFKGDVQWRGVIRDLLVYERALDHDEILNIWRAGLPDNFPRNTPVRQRSTSSKALPNWKPVVETRQLREFRHRRFTTEDGLPSNNIRALLQARDGLLWIATDNGLVQFDGTDFTTLSPTNTPALKLAGGDVRTLNEGPDGTIWAGTFTGLIRVRNGQVSEFSQELQEPFVLACVGETNGTVWLGGYQTGNRSRGVCQVRHFDPEKKILSASIEVPGLVRRMVVTHEGLWFSTEQPDLLLFWDRKTSSPKVVVSLARSPVRIALAAMTNLFSGKEPSLRLWEMEGNPTGWRAAFLEFPERNLSFEWIGGTNRSKAMVDTVQHYGASNGEQWVADRNDILLLHGDRLERILPSEADPIENISSVACNQEGGIWLGTERSGIHFLQEPTVRMYGTHDGMRNTEVNAVANVTTGLVVLATGSGACTFNGRNFGYFQGNDGGIEFAVSESREGVFWIASDMNSMRAIRVGTVDQVIMPELTRRPAWAFPNGIHETSSRALAFTTRESLVWFLPYPGANHSETNYLDQGEMVVDTLGRELPTNRLSGVTSDTLGRFWIGTQGAGLLRGFGTNKIEHLTSADGVPGLQCTVLRRDIKGYIWFQTEHGLARWRDNVFESATYSSGLPNDRFSDILEDRLGYYWLPGKTGLHRVSAADLDGVCEGKTNRVRSLTLGADDGLSPSECSTTVSPSSARDAFGRLFVATPNGLAVVDPKRVRDRPPPSPPRIRRVLINRKELPQSSLSSPGGLDLAPGSGGSLEVEFGSINLTHPEDLEYSYRLSGFDEGWSNRSRRQHAVFTNVRPGEYQMRIKVFNRRTRQESEHIALSLVIQPHFWQTRSFAMLLAVGLVGGVAGFHLRRLRIQADQKTKESNQRLMEERERIAADLHDELGAMMTKIAIQGENVKSSVDVTHHSQTKLTQIVETARQATLTISDMVWVTNPSNQTLPHLAAQIRQRTHQLIEDTGIELELRFDDVQPIPVSATFARNLLMITRECVNNAIKHSDTLQLEVCLRMVPGELFFCVTDHGKGILDENAPRSGSGLRNIQKRVRALHGCLEIQSSPGSGTQISMYLPLPGDPSFKAHRQNS